MTARLLFCLFLSLVIASIALAGSPEDLANQVVERVSKLSVPDSGANSFEHWTYNTANLTAAYCWRLIRGETQALPAALKRSGITRRGTWTAPKTAEGTKICESIAKHGIKPLCTHSTLWTKNVKRRMDLPLDYLQVHKNQIGRDQTLEIDGTIGCYLTPDQINKQSYVGPILSRWIQEPKPRSINTPTGPQTLESGTILITVPHATGLTGQNYQEPRTAVVVP